MNPRYIAYILDSGTSLSGETYFPSSSSATMGMAVKNDDDGYGAGTSGSNNGTIIANQAAIISKELLQSISGQVQTTVLPDPGMDLSMASYLDDAISRPGDYQSATKTFDWTTSYLNDSSNPDEMTNILSTLPADVEVLEVWHQWNGAGQVNGLSATETKLYDKYSGGALNPNIVVTEEIPLDGGETTIDLQIANNSPDPSARIGIHPTTIANSEAHLLALEGGRLRFKVKIKDGTPNGTALEATSLACYASAFVGFCLDQSDLVFVQNPDLYIRKIVDVTDPLPGQTINYTLIVSNEGSANADKVVIRDTLPTGLTFVAGSTSIMSPNGWSLGAPTTAAITGGTSITWTNLINGTAAVENPTPAIGMLPANSSEIVIKYRATVGAGLSQGTILTNGANIYDQDIKTSPTTPTTTCSYTDLSPDIFQNCTSVNVTVPKVNLKVVQTTSPSTVANGSYDIKVDYSNLSRQSSPNSYFILKLPNVTYQSVVTLAGEVVYFTDDAGATAPVFDPTAVNTAVWKNDVSLLSNPGKPTYIAVSMGTISGFAAAQRVLFTVKATHRDGTPAVIGESLTSTVELTSNLIKATPTSDADITNNTDSDITKIPGIDLVANIEGDIE
jgi:uncharacterized repeat protein (TIGR01451 family)